MRDCSENITKGGEVGVEANWQNLDTSPSKD